nr:uncharacterized protein LOC119187011 [Rhipicephalus microplus]
MSEPKISPSDPLKLWYSIKGDVRTAKTVALESLTLQSVDNSVYVMLQMNCDFIKKFEFLNISEIIVTNLRNGMSLMEISDCLRILAKYAKEMLKPTKERYKHWNKIPFMKAGAPQKWTRMDVSSAFVTAETFLCGVIFFSELFLGCFWCITIVRAQEIRRQM